MGYIYLKIMPWEFITIINLLEGPKLWRSKQKEKKLAEKKAKKEAKQGPLKTKEDKSIPLDQVITLDHLTNPEKSN